MTDRKQLGTVFWTTLVLLVGLVAYPLRNARLDIIPLWKDPLVLICSPEHALARNKSVRLKTLSGQKFIAFEPDIPTRRAVDRMLKEQGLKHGRISGSSAVELATASGAATLARAGVRMPGGRASAQRLGTRKYWVN